MQQAPLAGKSRAKFFPEVLDCRDDSAENDSDEKDHENPADVLKVQFAHGRRTFVGLKSVKRLRSVEPLSKCLFKRLEKIKVNLIQ